MRNPYIFDRPLSEQDLFIGRTAILDSLQRGLAEEQRFFLLYGKPRIGKTSLLNQLSLRLGDDYRIEILGWPDLRGQEPLERIMQVLREGSGLADEEADDPLAGPGAQMSALIDRLAVPSDGVMHVYCLDGVPLVDLQDAAAWSQAVEILRLALHGAPYVAVIITFAVQPAQVELEHSLVPTYVLERFTSRETEDLLMGATRGDLTYDLDAAAQIHRFAGGEPYFVQMFGRVLFEERSRHGWVDVPEVAHATDRVMALGTSLFEEQWLISSWATRVVLCVFGERVGSDGVVTAEDIGHYLHQLRIDIPSADVQAGLTELVNRDLLEMLGGQTYRFINTLFLRWIKREKNTLDTVHASRSYHQRRIEPTSGWATRKIDWLNILLWTLAIALAFGVAQLWRERERVITWTATPTPETTPTLLQQTPTIVPTPQRGVAPGYIAFMAKSDTDEPWAIFVMRSDGTDPVQLTERRSNDTSPMWSPDGKKLAFVSDRDGNREIYVMSADGSSQLNLTRHGAEDFTPSWSPDGTQLAFASFRDGNWEIYKMDADGANQQRLTMSPSAADYAPSWSPDGEHIAFVSDRSGDLDIWVMSSSGGGLTQFTVDPATDQSPAWSPDGEQLAWESYRTGNMEIYVANADGSDQHNVSQDAYADDHGVTWSPWGDQLAYYTNRDSGWDIMTLDLNSGQRTNITQSEDFEQSPQWGQSAQ